MGTSPMMRHLALAGCIGLGLLLLAAAAGWAAWAPGEECLACHGDKGLSREVGGKAQSLYTDAAKLQASVHGSLSCAACHAGAGEVPHAPKLPAVACESCHGPEADIYRTSAHGLARAKGNGAAATCQACHGTHEIQRIKAFDPRWCQGCHGAEFRAYTESLHAKALAKGDTDASLCVNCHGPAHALKPRRDPTSPVSHGKIAQTCAQCHADPALVARREITIPLAFRFYQGSVHGRAIAEGRNPRAATCSDCHGSHDLRRANDPRSSIFRDRVPATCGRCHAEVYERYRLSVHGTAVARGVTKSPVCNDCHGEHAILPPEDPASAISARAVSRTCAACHDAERIVTKYGLATQRVASYAESFHGLAARGGSAVVANCASCHGTHDILPSSDPRSAISRENLPGTCGKCHPGAGINFARGTIHIAPSGREEPPVYYARLFYLTLIALTVGGMAAHNGLDFVRKIRRHFRRRSGRGDGLPPQPEGNWAGEAEAAWIERMTRFERWQHGLLLVSFAVLVYTGFALKFPESWLFRWLVALEKGYAIRSWVHRGAAILLVATALLHVTYLLTRRGRIQLGRVRPVWQDVKDVVGNLAFLLGLRGEKPLFGHFSYVEKAEYWAVVWGSLVMIGTGFMLWFENETLRYLPKWALDVATVVHYYEAWLATLAIAVWHLYAVIFNPDVYPMNWTWLTGKISREQLREEHPGEFEGLRQQGEL